MKQKASVGRPAGRKKTAKIEVSLEPRTKETFMELVKQNGSNASVMLNEWISEYIQEKGKDIEE